MTLKTVINDKFSFDSTTHSKKKGWDGMSTATAGQNVGSLKVAAKPCSSGSDKKLGCLEQFLVEIS